MAGAKVSAGILCYRSGASGELEVLLVHPGGPLWARKDAGAWSIPKGEPDPDEELLAAAQRELGEETGLTPEGPFVPLPPVKQKGGKVVHAWAVRCQGAPVLQSSNTFSMIWPPRSGQMQSFPEVDRAEFFSADRAREKLNPAQVVLLDELTAAVRRESR